MGSGASGGPGLRTEGGPAAVLTVLFTDIMGRQPSQPSPSDSATSVGCKGCRPEMRLSAVPSWPTTAASSRQRTTGSWPCSPAHPAPSGRGSMSTASWLACPCRGSIGTPRPGRRAHRPGGMPRRRCARAQRACRTAHRVGRPGWPGLGVGGAGAGRPGRRAVGGVAAHPAPQGRFRAPGRLRDGPRPGGADGPRCTCWPTTAGPVPRSRGLLFASRQPAEGLPDAGETGAGDYCVVVGRNLGLAKEIRTT